MNALPLFLNMAGRAVIVVGEGPMADAKTRLLERAGARIVAGDDPAAKIAIVAVEDAGRAAILAGRLRARGLLVNAVDRPELSDFTFPAIVDRAPLTVAIGTGGASAGLAKTVRQRIEALLPADLGALARALRSAKPAIRARWPDGDERRRALDLAFAAGGPLDPTASDGVAEDGAARVAGWLESADPTPEDGRITHVRVASDDPDELTLRAARLLGAADRVYHPANMSGLILDRARADAVRIAGAPPTLPLRGLSVALDWS